MAKLTGGCLCSEIRYEANGEPIASLNCYCRDCQYITGGSQNSSLMMPKSGFKITKGTPSGYISKSDSGNKVTRQFCGKCGTPLFAENETLKDFIVIKVGSLDDPSSFKSAVNFWVSSAQPWHHVDPDIPQFDTQPT